MDDGLVAITSDKTMLDMFAMHKDNNSNVIDVYVHNPMMEHKKPSDEEESSLTKADHSGQIDDLIDLDDLVAPDDIAELDQGIIPTGPVDEDDESDKVWDRGDDNGDESGDNSDDDSFSGFIDSDEDDLEDDEEVEQGVGVVVINEPAIEIMNEEGELSDKSDDVRCLSNDEEEEEGGHKRKKKFIEFDEAKDIKNPKLVEVMVFPNVTAFRGLLKEFHIREGCEYTYLKNESSRVTVICQEKCGFRLHASPVHGEKSFQIKRLSANHCCTRKYIKYATSKWIAKKYMEGLTDEPNKKVKTLKNDVRRKWMLDVSSKKAYKVKKAALNVIHGNHEEQYLRLRDYCMILVKQNPGSTALLKVDRLVHEQAVVFQRLFICFDAQAKGFLASCRPFIGLDACFLKGPYGGQLMHATTRDGNNQMYPLCMAIVEAELKDSWVWFLENLLAIIGRPEERGWCFMSDRQKGLIEAFKQLMPNVEHRFCLRHMYANFNKTYKGKEYKAMFWGAASAYTIPEFNEKMAEIKNVDKKAHEWLLNEVPEVWARAYNNPRSMVNRMDNNMSEGFNTWISEARDKPIVTLVDTIRRQLMVRYVARLDYSSKFKGKLCPSIAKNVERKKVNARGLQVIYSGGSVFEVTSADKVYVVDIGEHSCTCRRWDLNGIPCTHGCTAIISHKAQPEDYVNDCYSTKTFMRTYSQRIYPIPDKSLWPTTECDPIMPPPIRTPIGRPKKARRKGVVEPQNPYKVRKHHITLMCRQCGTFGHNRRT
ncbi:uncharacterized protein LOC131298654 [Rhododendron vialii]|uniref:uncharacterized protein LOC131298654 n=1 Tax=Rhododendron vialii TaxID=182163 RepID=UPI00265DE46E|nr:uncharacterized protein LOC131298654 [Rhododendron vialii]